MSEQSIQQNIRVQLGHGDVRLWRNNTGCLKDQQGRFVRFGLATGSSDLIGLRKVTITPDMVGQEVGVFCAVEVKSPTGKPTAEQLRFIQCVRGFGGFAGVARSVEEAANIIFPPDSK